MLDNNNQRKKTCRDDLTSCFRFCGRWSPCCDRLWILLKTLISEGKTETQTGNLARCAPPPPVLCSDDTWEVCSARGATLLPVARRPRILLSYPVLNALVCFVLLLLYEFSELSRAITAGGDQVCGGEGGDGRRRPGGGGENLIHARLLLHVFAATLIERRRSRTVEKRKLEKEKQGNGTRVTATDRMKAQIRGDG